MRVISSCLVATLAVAGLSTPAAAADADPVRLDVGLTGLADSAAVVAALGADVLDSDPVPGLDAITVDVPADRSAAVRAALAARTDVRYAEVGGLVLPYADPYDKANLTRLNWMSIPGAREVTTGSDDIVVAVVDSGVTPNADLGADRLTAGYDFVDGDADPADGGSHGTLLANLIAAPANGVGFTGICPRCRIMPVRVLRNPASGTATGSTANLAAGIVWAADHGAQIINLSLGTVADSPLLRDAIQHAVRKNAFVVGASGNDPGSARHYPAAIDEVLAVGVVGGQARNSPTDRWIDVRAFNGIAAMDPLGRPIVSGQSSAAAAATSGIAALVLAANPTFSPSEIRHAITDSATLLSKTQYSFDPRVVDALGAVTGVDRSDQEPPRFVSLGVDGGRLVGKTGLLISPTISDNVAVARVEFLLDGKVVQATEAADTPTPAYVRVSPPLDFVGEVEFAVRAYDHSGNVATEQATLRFDGRAPRGSIVSPAPGTLTRGPVDVVFSSPDKDLDYVHLDGAPMTQVPGTDLWKARMTLTRSSDVIVFAADEAWNNSEWRVPVVVDNAGPTASAVSPAANTRVRGTFTSTLSGAGDPSGIAKAELWANDRFVWQDTVAPYSLKVNTGSFSGNVKLIWRLTDKLGNTRYYTRTVVADNKAPTVSITKAPKNKAKVSGTVKVYVKASDASGIARVELIVNGKVVAKDTKTAYVLSIDSKTQPKTMKVTVRAYDKLGNVKYTSERTWYRR
ncbi:S8 family serine peptidase [Actinoplanes sp. NPDC049118]|uniref:S8 family serine peptidase n=1 Tax=Actinoplanes sp. NPDC049118 TaxID=3155769 RepID=UPI0033EF29D6